jgi:hypothetical protein
LLDSDGSVRIGTVAAAVVAAALLHNEGIVLGAGGVLCVNV